MSGSNDFLQAMAASSTERLQVARAAIDLDELERRAATLKPPPPLQLSSAGFDLIAEVK